MSATQILARIEILMMDKSQGDVSILFSVENDLFWVRTVVNGVHVEAEGKSLIEAFQKFIQNKFTTHEHQ